MTDRDTDEAELKERLQYLRDQLDHASSLRVDEESGLDKFADDLFQTVVHGRDKEIEPEEAHHLRERLERYAAEFDAEHPKTSGVLRQIGGILERMGI